MVQALTAQLFVGGAWTSYDAYTAEQVEVSIGPDTDTGTAPNKISLAWENDDLAMDPYNPESALYGQIGRNTKCRVRVGGITLTQAEASQWEPDATVDHVPGARRGRAWTAFEAQGLLGRLSQWEEPIADAMTRQLVSYASLVGLWPLTGGNSDTTRLTEISGALGASAGSIAGTVSMGGNPGPGGGQACVEIGSGAKLSGRFKRHTTSGWQFVFHSQLTATPSSATYENLARLRLSNANTVEWQINNTNYRVVITSPAGVSLLSSAASHGGIDVTGWIRYRLKVTVSGGTVTVEPAWYAQDHATTYGYTDTYSASSTGALLDWDIVQNAWNLGAGYSHVLGITDTSLDVINSFDVHASFNGYLGELAAYRYSRLMIEEGLVGYVGGDPDTTPPMGRQKPGVFLDLLEECMVTARALMYDEPTDIALMFRVADDIRDQTTKLALTKGVDVAPPLKPVTGYQLSANHVTVTNSDGAEVVLVDETSRMGTAPPPAGIGVQKLKVEVSLENTDQGLDDRASWELAAGTIDQPQFRTIVIDLLANPEHASACSSLRPGDLITIAGAVPDTVRLHVLKIVHKVGAQTRTVTLSTRPADVWAFGEYDDTGAKYDSTSVTTSGSSNTSTTTIAVKSTSADTACYQSGGYDVIIAGERMTVSAASAPSGGTNAQNLTVTRSVNGVTKPHVADEPVRLMPSIRYQ